MNESEMADAMARSADTAKSRADAFNAAFEKAVKSNLASGKRVTIEGYGSFNPTTTYTVNGRNPRTGETMVVTKYKRAKVSGTVSRGALIDQVAKDAGMSAAEADRLMSARIGATKTALYKGDMVTNRGFGMFYVGKVAARNGKLPSGATYIMAPHRRVGFRTASYKGARFMAAKAMREAVN